MLQWCIYVSVTVITDSGSDLVESQLDDIFIVTSPYKILFTKTTKYFKPGMPFYLMVFVTNPDGTPAQRIPVVAEPGKIRGITHEDGTVQLNLNTRSDLNQMQITVSTTDDKLDNDQQASATMVASAYKLIGGNYLHLSVSRENIKPGGNAVVSFMVKNHNGADQDKIKHFNFVVMNKGRIIKVGTQERGKGQSIAVMSLPITKELIPSFRILAYYTVPRGAGWEIVADSVWIDVADTCIGTLVITGERYRDNAIQQPRGSMKLKIQADHKAAVGLVAVDKGVYMVNNKLKISQSKIWDSVEKYDIGCTLGSGADTPGVFYDAGLALQTSFQITTPQRSEALCHPERKRRRRSSDDEDTDFIDDADIISRTHFPESWLWKVEIMNERPDANQISTKSLSVYFRDSITTWEVLAVSLSESKGLCVSKPYDIAVRMDFFIDLKLPYSVVRNEQVEIRAILYNYGNSPLKVRVDWTYNEQFCSLSTAKKKYRQEVTIKDSSSVALPFIIVPLTLGYHDIEVKAAGLYISDSVKKTLKVVPEGRRLTQTLKSVVLDPEEKGGVQEELISAVNPKNIVPKTQVDTIVTIQGSPISEMVEKSIDGVNLKHLIMAPEGNGEQNMMRMTSPLIATHYLDFSNQWEQVGLQKREQAIQFIKIGVVQQMAFKKPDASYGVWIHTPSSTWLTAYVVKVFSLASSLVVFDKNTICNSVEWLILNKQYPDGEFREDVHVYHQEMAGGITKGSTELDSSLTAFILISLLTSEQICTDRVASLPGSIGKATQYLNGRYETLKKPYSIAITSYALAKAGKLKDTKILMSASTDNTHWDDPGSRYLSLEATSYALLTLLKMKAFDKAAPLVKWLTEQRYYGEFSGSTQSTMMQFEALAQYLIDVPNFKDLDMVVSFKLPGSSKSITHRLNLQNAMLARSEQTSAVGDFTVTAKGKGQGTLTVFSVYYALETEKEKKCNNFHLSVTIKDEPDVTRPEGAKSTVSITICTRFLKDYDATMSILDISMMTGFSPDINDLNKLKRGMHRYISNYEINKGQFDKGTLILYIDKISHKEDECLKFNLHQYFAVGLIQPGSVTVYDYYSPENRCTKFYHVEEGSKLLGRICKGEVCRCAEENCFMQQQLEKVDALVRVTQACGVSVDYVYKMKLTTIENGDDYDSYVMTVQTVIKKGTDIVVANDKRNFISHAKCRKALNLEIGRDYVIWGVTEDLWNTGSSGFSYMITKDTWIEMWPSSQECWKPEYETLCEELFQFADELEFHGCTR